MKKLKLKIFASFMLLVLLLAVAGVLSIMEFRRLSHSVGMLIDNNFKSIEAARTMLDAIERQDSGILLLMLGETGEGNAIIQSGEQSFISALEVARNNLTEPDEAHYLEDIEVHYQAFRSKWMAPMEKETAVGLEWYHNEIHVSFLETKQAIYALMSLNQQSMYQQAAHLREEARRAIMLGIVAIAAALIFSLLLNFFLSRYFIRPITSLSAAIDQVRKDDSELEISIQSNDEIKSLERAINKMLLRLRS